MDLLVFGSEGKIGSNLCKDLQKKINITGIDNIKKNDFTHNFKKINLDLKKIKLPLLKAKNSLILSFYKSQPKDFNSEKPKIFLDKNNLILDNCLNVSNKSGVEKIIYISSVAVYKKKRTIKKITEKNTINDNNIYSKFKILAENKIKKFCKKNKINYIILRLFHYYDDNGNYLIENFKSQLLKNKKIVIFGSGAQKLDFLYSKDLSKVILKLCIMNIKNKTLNLCTGSGVKISEIANSLVNDKKSIVYQNNKGGDLSLVGNNEKLSKLINYYPKNNIRFILKKLK